MKKLCFCLTLLLWTSNLNAQRQDTESPVFIIDGIEIPAIGLKSAKTATDSLIPWSLPDTVIGSKTTDEYAMYIYTYDERGNAISTEAFSKAGIVWIPSQRIDATFNRWDCIDTTTNYFYQSDSYVPNARKISTYDKHGRHISLLNQTWNASMSVWTPTSRYTYTYTEDNRLQSSLKESPDLQSSGWKNNEKIEYSYDSDGHETAFEMFIWTGSEWFPYRAYYRTYDKDRIVKENGRMLNEFSGSYGDTYRFEYTYDESGNLTDYLQFYTDTTGKWDTTLHSAYLYSDGLVSEECTRTFDAALGRLENSTREYYFYDKDGLKDSVAHEVWLSFEWVHTVSYRYFYNESGIRDSWIYYNVSDDNRRTDKYELSFNENGDGTLAQCFTLQDGNWVPANRYDLEVYRHNGELILRSNYLLLCKISVSYADGFKTPGPLPDTTSSDTTIANEHLKAIMEANVSVYPNPAVGTLYVEISGEGSCGVTLSELSGRTVEAFRMTAGHKALDVSRYKGTYVLRVQKDGAVIAKKIIIL